MKFVNTLVAALSLFVATSASAGEFWGSVMFGSYHTDRQTNYNEVNPGVGVEYKLDVVDNVRLLADRYKNSYSRASNFFGAAWTPLNMGDVHVGIAAGTVSGYKLYDYGYGPVAAGYVTWEGSKYGEHRYGVNLLILPPTNVKGDPPTWVFALQAKMKF